jgi:hypothetical protein
MLVKLYSIHSSWLRAAQLVLIRSLLLTEKLLSARIAHLVHFALAAITITKVLTTDKMVKQLL